MTQHDGDAPLDVGVDIGRVKLDPNANGCGISSRNGVASGCRLNMGIVQNPINPVNQNPSQRGREGTGLTSFSSPVKYNIPMIGSSKDVLPGLAVSQPEADVANSR